MTKSGGALAAETAYRRGGRSVHARYAHEGAAVAAELIEGLHEAEAAGRVGVKVGVGGGDRDGVGVAEEFHVAGEAAAAGRHPERRDHGGVIVRQAVLRHVEPTDARRVVAEDGPAEQQHGDEVVGMIVLDVYQRPADALLHREHRDVMRGARQIAAVHHELDHRAGAEPHAVPRPPAVVQVVHIGLVDALFWRQSRGRVEVGAAGAGAAQNDRAGSRHACRCCHNGSPGRRCTSR